MKTTDKLPEAIKSELLQGLELLRWLYAQTGDQRLKQDITDALTLFLIVTNQNTHP